MNNLFCCKGKRLANYLLDKNCKLIKIDCDKESRGFLVFIFVKNKELDSALTSWEQDKNTYLI